MAYEVVIQRSALKALQQIDRPERKRIAAAIDGLADEPRPRGVVPVVKESGAYRIRVGTYRVLYEIHDAELRVLVVKIAHRSSAYSH